MCGFFPVNINKRNQCIPMNSFKTKLKYLFDFLIISEKPLQDKEASKLRDLNTFQIKSGIGAKVQRLGSNSGFFCNSFSYLGFEVTLYPLYKKKP